MIEKLHTKIIQLKKITFFTKYKPNLNEVPRLQLKEVHPSLDSKNIFKRREQSKTPPSACVFSSFLVKFTYGKLSLVMIDKGDSS